MSLHPARVLRPPLECGGLTPPWNHVSLHPPSCVVSSLGVGRLDAALKSYLAPSCSHILPSLGARGLDAALDRVSLPPARGLRPPLECGLTPPRNHVCPIPLVCCGLPWSAAALLPREILTTRATAVSAVQRSPEI